MSRPKDFHPTVRNMLKRARDSACVFGCSQTEELTMDYDNSTFDVGIASQLASCANCGGEWLEKYRLNEIEIITRPDPEVQEQNNEQSEKD